MSETENNNDKQIDNDILQCKADVLRARDIIPSSNKPSQGQLKNEIPTFDLAEHIMAEQRRSTSTKRKSPGRQSQTQDAPVKDAVIRDAIIIEETPVKNQHSFEFVAPQRNPIISDIVARDIKKLCLMEKQRAVRLG